MSTVPVLEPRFGVWALVYGTWASLHHPDDPLDASWERNKRQILEAEDLGFDTTLVAQQTINPYGDHLDQIEAWTATAALAEVTSRIEIITAIKPYLFHPVVFAKMLLQIEEISGGRAALNLVNAWYKPELVRAGIPFAPHDERYDYGKEWITIVRDLIAGRRTSFDGKYFTVDEYQLRPAGQFRERPTIYLGGESESARALAADRSDVWFINGQPPEDVAALIEDVASRPRTGPPVRFGLSAYVIARDTDEEAEQELEAAWELAKSDAAEFEQLWGNADKDAVMIQNYTKNPYIGTNGGTAAGLVGSYDTVSERIGEFNELGIETFMLQFQPFEAETRRFALEVIPRVRRLSARAAYA